MRRFLPLQKCCFVKTFLHRTPSIELLKTHQAKKIFSSKSNFAFPKFGFTQINALIDLQGNRQKIACVNPLQIVTFSLFSASLQ